VPIVELVLVLFAVFVVATPPLTVFLLWRQHKLRQELLKFTQSSIEQSDALHRELFELRRQVAASPRAAEVATTSVEVDPRPAVVIPSKTEEPVPFTLPVEAAAKPGPTIAQS
jgi:hypothetical protein